MPAACAIPTLIKKCELYCYGGRYGAQELFAEEPAAARPSGAGAAEAAAADATANGSGAPDTAADAAGAGASAAPGTAAAEAAGTSNGTTAPAEAAKPASARIVWDDAAVEQLLDRTELNARVGVEEEDGDDDEDLMKAFKVGSFFWQVIVCLGCLGWWRCLGLVEGEKRHGMVKTS